MPLRKALNKMYLSGREVTTGIDPKIPILSLSGVISRKLWQKVFALSRGYSSAFIALSVDLQSKRQIKLGNNVSIAPRVSISGLSTEGISIGNSVTIDTGAILRASGVIRNLGVGIIVGDRTSIGAFNLILGQGGVKIGNDCLLGPNVTVLSENHIYVNKYIPIRDQGEKRESTEIEDDVWIGAGVTVLAGARIGRGCVVAAGAVVRGDVAPYSIIGGIPAKELGQRSDV